MADKRVTDLTELTSAASDDVVYIVDISDTTDHSSGTSKKIKISNISSSGGISSRTRVNGSTFTVTGDNRGRSYTFAFGLSGKEIIAVGSSGGRLTILDPVGGYSLSTVSVTNDTITVVDELFDDEAVIVWL